MNYQKQQLVTTELLERSSVPQDFAEKHFILSFLGELPLEELKRLTNFEYITMRSAEEKINHAQNAEEASYWRSIYFKLRDRGCIQMNCSYQAPINFDMSNLKVEQISESQK